MSSKQDYADNSMMELFRAEVDSHTQSLSEGLLALEKDPGQLKLIEPLMRAAHSIKGAARIVGVDDGVKVSHVMEDLLVAAQGGQVVLTSEAIDALLRGVDALVRIATPDTDDDPSEQEIESLVKDLAQARQSKPRGNPKPPSPPPVEVKIAPKPQLPASPIQQAESGPEIESEFDGEKSSIFFPNILDSANAEKIRKIFVGHQSLGSNVFDLDLGKVTRLTVEGLTFLANLKPVKGDYSIHFRNVPASLMPLFTNTDLSLDCA